MERSGFAGSSPNEVRRHANADACHNDEGDDGSRKEERHEDDAELGGANADDPHEQNSVNDAGDDKARRGGCRVASE